MRSNNFFIETVLWELVDSMDSSSRRRLEEAKNQPAVSLIEYGYRRALEDLCAFLQNEENVTDAHDIEPDDG